MTWEYLMKIVTSAGAVVALLIGISALFEKTRNYLKWLWRQLKPAVKFVLAAASLILPNALIIGILTYKVAIYNFEAGSLDIYRYELDSFCYLGERPGVPRLALLFPLGHFCLPEDSYTAFDQLTGLVAAMVGTKKRRMLK